MKSKPIDSDMIQQKIDIICASINKYRNMLKSANHLSEEVLIDIKVKLEKEERILQKYKDNHSEYFI